MYRMRAGGRSLLAASIDLVYVKEAETPLWIPHVLAVCSCKQPLVSYS